MGDYHYNGTTARLREIAVEVVGSTGMEPPSGKRQRPGPLDLRYAYPLRVQVDHIKKGIPHDPRRCALARCGVDQGAAAAYMMDEGGYVLLQNSDGEYRWFRGLWRGSNKFVKKFDDGLADDLGPHGQLLFPASPSRRLTTMRNRADKVAREVKEGERKVKKDRHKMPAFKGSKYVAPRGQREAA